MINEANGTPSHRDMIALLERSLRSAGAATAREYKLPNGKIADLCYATQFDGIHVVEVKTTLSPYLFSQAFRKYGGHCHYLWMAAPAFDPGLRMPEDMLHRWSTSEDRIGLLAVSWAGVSVIRPSRLLDGPPLNSRQTLERLRAKLTAGEVVPLS